MTTFNNVFIAADLYVQSRRLYTLYPALVLNDEGDAFVRPRNNREVPTAWLASGFYPKS